MSMPLRIASVKPKQTNFTTYRYLREFNRKDLHQLAFKFFVDFEQETVTFSVATCSPKDNFDFSKARKLLDKRFSNVKSEFRFFGDYESDYTLIQNAIDNIDMALWDTQVHFATSTGRKKKKLETQMQSYELILKSA